MSDNFIPHWLTGTHKKEAIALCEMGFWYIGTIDEYGNDSDIDEKRVIQRFGDWLFSYCYVGIFVEARCNGAVFNTYVEDSTEEEDKELVAKAIKAIQQSTKNDQQLSLFPDLV